MTEFQRALDQFLEGRLDGDSLVTVLRQTLAASPDAAEELIGKVRDLRGQERITERLYSTLMTQVRTDGTADDDDAATVDLTATRVSGEREDEAVRDRESLIGAVFRERFVLESEIGRGGMGVVYCARDLRREEAGDHHNKIAIKVLAGSIKDHPDAFVALQREAKRAQQLAHPNIATVYDFDREGDIAYLCMELLTGRPLDEVLAETTGKGMPLAKALPIIRGMANGLAYAHERGIVHADFKPNNVFLTDRNTVKILDFGIARVVSKPDQTTKTVFDAGNLRAMTPAYASCEMFNWQEPDPRDDLYALACVSYELLAGRHPFSHLAAPLARENNLRPKPIAAVNRRGNRALQHGLAFERADRTASVERFVDELAPRRNGAVVGGLAMGAGVAGFVAVVGLAAWVVLDEEPGTGTDVPMEGDAQVESDRPTGNEVPTENDLLTETDALMESDSPAGSEALTVSDEPTASDTPAGGEALTVSDAEIENDAPTASDAEIENDAPTESAAVAVSAADRPPEPVDAETRARIARILEVADLHMARGRLVEPAGSNAAEAYAAVGELQPGNRESLEGLAAVAAGIEQRALELARDDAQDEALEIVNEGLRWLPGHPGLTRLRGDLEKR